MIRLSYRTNLILNRIIPKSSLSPSCCKRQYHASRIVMGDLIEQQKTEAPIFIPKRSVEPSEIIEKDIQHQPQHSLASKTEFVDSLFATKFEHIALIKIQGPFTPLDLKSVAKTLVHLQELGLMPIAILDNDEWKEMLKGDSTQFNELRQWMMEDSTNFCEALEDAGGRATPIYNGVFTLTHDESEKDNKKNRSSLKLRTLSTDADAKINVSLSWLKSSLKLGHIPLILPIALDGLSMQRTIQPNAGMVALSRSLSDLSNATCLNLKTPHLEPMKIIVINSEGGIPSSTTSAIMVPAYFPSLYSLIEASFKKKLDIDNYVARLKKCLDLIIVTGDYQGAAIVTMENGVPYLDKFAVLPNNQGTGIADILWKQLQIRHPNLMWRSRDSNGVNKWYFERSDGNYMVPETRWLMFWYGRDGIDKIKTYTEAVKNIPPSFL